MKDQVKNYSLTVLEMEQAVDIIEGDTIDLEYKASDEAEAAIKDQNASSDMEKIHLIKHVSHFM